MEATATESLLNTRQVAQILGCGYSKANQLMHSKNLATVNIASPSAKRQALRVARDELNEFIKKGGCQW